MKKFLPIAMAAVMSMSAVAVSAVSANAGEPLNTPSMHRLQWQAWQLRKFQKPKVFTAV